MTSFFKNLLRSERWCRILDARKVLQLGLCNFDNGATNVTLQRSLGLEKLRTKPGGRGTIYIYRSAGETHVTPTLFPALKLGTTLCYLIQSSIRTTFKITFTGSFSCCWTLASRPGYKLEVANLSGVGLSPGSTSL